MNTGQKMNDRYWIQDRKMVNGNIMVSEHDMNADSLSLDTTKFSVMPDLIRHPGKPSS